MRLLGVFAFADASIERNDPPFRAEIAWDWAKMRGLVCWKIHRIGETVQNAVKSRFVLSLLAGQDGRSCAGAALAIADGYDFELRCVISME